MNIGSRGCDAEFGRWTSKDRYCSKVISQSGQGLSYDRTDATRPRDVWAMMDTESRLSNAMQVLKGEALWAANVAAGMLMLQFGARTEVKKRSGKEVEVGKFAIHVQCPWRLSRQGAIIISGSDDDGIESIEDFCSRVPVVREVYAGLWRLSLIFEDGSTFEAFPATSTADENTEFWRMLSPSGYWKTQLVVGPGGAEGL